MNTTSLTLLDQLRQPDPAEARDRFVRLYAPLLQRWTQRAGLKEADAADLIQEVFAILLNKLPMIQCDAAGSFRGWLRTVTMNKLRDAQRRLALHRPVPLAAANGLAGIDPAEAFWELEYQRELQQSAAALIRAEFAPTTWAACWEFLHGERPARDVAATHGVSENAVYIAKCRVVRRLREELAGLL